MELFKLFATIAIRNKEANEALDDTSNKAEKSHGRIGKAFAKIGSAAVKLGKTVAVGLLGSQGAITVLAKKAVEAYADYEQLVGGVETLFGKSADIVMNYANNAYKTAGMSANAYMETVTGFSASLLQSLDNDTEQAAKKADVAITDMSDNANKMGTSIESIQNAYQGFAKQNYTMLDNLKLGYGGTKEEMQRLLSDAEKLSGQKFDLSSYADIVDAIHIVQNEMGITGTTAKEAATTIQGSISSFKASWQNLLVGMADDSQDFDALLTNVIDNGITVIGNILPKVQVVFNSIPKLINGIVPQIPGLLQGILPGLLEGATQLLTGLVAALPSIVNILMDILPVLMDAILQIGSELVNVLPLIINSLVAFLTDQSTITSIFQAAVVLLMTIIAAVPQLVGQLLQAAPDIIMGLVTGLINSIPQLLEGLKQVLNQFLDLFLSFFGIHSPSRLMAEKARYILEGIINGIKELPQKAAEIFIQMRDRLIEKVENIKSVVSDKFNSVKSKILTPIENARDRIKDIVDKIKGFFSGMKLSFPDIKLPHFKINPSGWKIGDLLEGSIPKLGIDWYDKAMDDGMIMNEPTIFGVNSKGQPMGGGETGSETVVGTQSLINMINGAVEQSNNGLYDVLDKILKVLKDIDDSMFDRIVKALQTMGIEFDERELARLVKKYA